jgi:hypothetical protein
MRATCPAHLVLDLVTLIVFPEAYKLWKFSCSLLQPPATSSTLGPNIHLSAAFSNSLCSSLVVRDEVIISLMLVQKPLRRYRKQTLNEI